MKIISFLGLVAMLLLSACGSSGGDDSDYITSASDATVNGCAELAGVAKFAMKNRQNGVSLDAQMAAAGQSAVGANQAAAEMAVVRNVYRLPISTSPSDAWGITQTACLKAAQ